MYTSSSTRAYMRSPYNEPLANYENLPRHNLASTCVCVCFFFILLFNVSPCTLVGNDDREKLHVRDAARGRDIIMCQGCDSWLIAIFGIGLVLLTLSFIELDNWILLGTEKLHIIFISYYLRLVGIINTKPTRFRGFDLRTWHWCSAHDSGKYRYPWFPEGPMKGAGHPLSESTDSDKSASIIFWRNSRMYGSSSRVVRWYR